MKIRPAASINGVIRVPGDKSVSHRAVMLASIADGTTSISNYSPGEDCASTIRCMQQLSVEIEHEGTNVVVRGVGKNGLQKPEGELDCGNSGTTMRLLAGIVAGQNFVSVLNGDESLQKRPMHRIAYPLKKMGARVESRYSKPPLTITGKDPLLSIEYSQVAASAQVKSCVLLAGLNADGLTIVIEPVPTRDHTERMLEWFGVDVALQNTVGGTRISVSGDAKLRARDLSVPSDISSAAFFMVTAACLTGSDITLPNLGVNSSRKAIIDVMTDLGADITLTETSDVCNEPVATIRVRSGLRASEKPAVLSGPIIPKLIDEIPVLAVLGTQLANGLEVRDAAELRVKECDRITAIVENLKCMGAKVAEFDDGFRVERFDLVGAEIDSYGDHRIAMAFGVAGLMAKGETHISGAECADISFPGFFETLKAVSK